jgi:hypothetical protein
MGPSTEPWSGSKRGRTGSAPTVEVNWLRVASWSCLRWSTARVAGAERRSSFAGRRVSAGTPPAPETGTPATPEAGTLPGHRERSPLAGLRWPVTPAPRPHPVHAHLGSAKRSPYGSSALAVSVVERCPPVMPERALRGPRARARISNSQPAMDGSEIPQWVRARMGGWGGPGWTSGPAQRPSRDHPSP